jgi:hypothetical protein
VSLTAVLFVVVQLLADFFNAWTQGDMKTLMYSWSNSMASAGFARATEHGPAGRVWPRLRDNRVGLAGLVVVLFFGLIAMGVALGLLGQDWSAASGGRWEVAGVAHWFGTTCWGRTFSSAPCTASASPSKSAWL